MSIDFFLSHFCHSAHLTYGLLTSPFATFSLVSQVVQYFVQLQLSSVPNAFFSVRPELFISE